MNQLKNHFDHKLQNLTIGIWGLAFKPDTDDMREASSLVIIQALLEAGCKLRVYDPAAMITAQKYLGVNNAIIWCACEDEVLQDRISALVIATEWQVFKNYPLTVLKNALRDAPIIDGRNCYNLSEVQASGIAYYYSVGRPLICKDRIVEESIA